MKPKWFSIPRINSKAKKLTRKRQLSRRKRVMRSIYRGSVFSPYIGESRGFLFMESDNG